MHRIQGYIQIHQLTNQAFRDLFKAGLRQSGKHIHIHADPVIQSRGEEQGRGAGGGGASGRKQQRAGEGTDLGGLGRLQGGAEEQRREADGSPAGRRTGSRWVPREADARRAPAGRSSSRGLEGPCREKQREAGGAAAGDAGGGGATGAPRLAREAEARLVAPPRLSCGRFVGPASNSRACSRFLPAPFFPSRSRATRFPALAFPTVQSVF